MHYKLDKWNKLVENKSRIFNEKLPILYLKFRFNKK